MATKFEVQHIADSHIHHTQKSLIPPLELSLVEYLNSNNRRILDRSRVWKEMSHKMASGVELAHIKAFIPIRIESLFNDACRVCLLRIDGYDCEWIGQPENISFG
jgi:hypothetical protein